ncbi:hypothetical protein [Nonomuraea sp. NPDC048916]|uniref:hypothetical protein n=1 Tax=Nonomuraea sp. NPDC048916 TaxID=3154232 RepID=UPI0033D41F1E
MTTRTEQETRRGAPVRGAMPTTGPKTRRRPGVPQQSKPIPRPRPAADAPMPEARPARPAVNRQPSRRRQHAPFVLLVLALLCGGLVSLLLLNTVLAQDSITATTLREEIATARLQNEQVAQEIQKLTQPGALSEGAERQGLGRDWKDVNPLRGAADDADRVGQER